MSNWVQHTIPELCDWWITTPLWPSDSHHSQVNKPYCPSPAQKLFFLSKESRRKWKKKLSISIKILPVKNSPELLLTKPSISNFMQKYPKILLRLLEYTYVFWNTLLLKQTRIIFINWDCPIFTLELFQNREWPFLAIHNTITLQILTNNHTDCLHDVGNIIRASTSF